jgi:hypothetical protein
VALSESTLAAELANMVPTMSEGDAATALAQAYADYMDNAIANGGSPVPIIAAAVQAQVTGMASVVDFEAGDSASEGAAEVIKCFNRLWDRMVAFPASFFSGATAVTKPTFAGLQAALAATFTANTTNRRSRAQSAAALAADIHPATDGKGTATFPGPVIKTIT